MRVMKEPLTLDDAALGPESETREELVWKLQSYEEQIKQLSEENMVCNLSFYSLLIDFVYRSSYISFSSL